MNKWIDSYGRKFYILREGVLKTYWFALICTFGMEFVKQACKAAKLGDIIDSSPLWTFLKYFTWFAIGGFLTYAGINVWQKKVNNIQNNNTNNVNNIPK